MPAPIVALMSFSERVMAGMIIPANLEKIVMQYALAAYANYGLTFLNAFYRFRDALAFRGVPCFEAQVMAYEAFFSKEGIEAALQDDPTQWRYIPSRVSSWGTPHPLTPILAIAKNRYYWRKQRPAKRAFPVTTDTSKMKVEPVRT